MLRCRLESAIAGDNITRLVRPVVRLDDGAVVLTTIDPANHQTAMLMRIRWGLFVEAHG